VAAIVESIARIARVIEVDAVDPVAVHEIADDRVGVVRRLREDRRRVEAFDFVRLRTGPSGEFSDVRRTLGLDRRELLRDVTRHHEPRGMAVDDVFTRGRQIGGARDQVDVDPRMHAQPCGMSRFQNGFERIEGVGLPQELRRTRLHAAQVVRIAASAHLHEQRVEAVVARGAHERCDVVWCRQRSAEYPECARFHLRVLCRYGGQVHLRILYRRQVESGLVRRSVEIVTGREGGSMWGSC